MLSILTGLDHHTTKKKIKIFLYDTQDAKMTPVHLDRVSYWFMYRHLLALVSQDAIKYCPSAISIGWTRFEV